MEATDMYGTSDEFPINMEKNKLSKSTHLNEYVML